MSAMRLISLSRPCPGVSAEQFFAIARGRERFYWNDDAIAFAGMGVAVEITAWGERRFAAIAEKARALFDGMHLIDGDPIAGARLFGGFSFQSDFITEHTWAQFAPAYFVLPHYQLVAQGDVSWLTLNVQIDADEPVDVDALRAALDEQVTLVQQRAAQLDTPPQRHPLHVGYPMSFDDWNAIIRAATDRMRAGDLKKVVLARVCELRFDGRVDPAAALAYLNDAYAGCTRFVFEPLPDLAFFGATPELLVSTRGTQIETEALAGSIRRGGTAADDEALAAALLADPKEREEHHLVVEGIRERLAGWVTDLHHDEAPGILRLKNIQHLHTPIAGTLRQPVGVLPLVELLHPTPALGGTPRATALDFIRRMEPVPRGWYAAPVGWIDAAMDGAFVVAIRSAVSQGERVWLYAGAGIVAESQPEREWDETALKFKPMLTALGATIDVLAQS